MKEIEVSGYEPFVEEIHRQQEENGWGTSIVQVLSKELQKEFPGQKDIRRQIFGECETFI